MSPSGRVIRLDERQLRAAADVLRRFTGLRLELPPSSYPPSLVGGGRCGKQLAIVRRLGALLRGRLPAGRAAVEGALLEGLPPERTDGGHAARTGSQAWRFTPDMVVCSAEFLDSEERSLYPQAVDIAVEVVTPGASDACVTEAVARYAAAEVPVLLVVDPRPRAPAPYVSPRTGIRVRPRPRVEPARAEPARAGPARAEPAPSGGGWSLHDRPVGGAYRRSTGGAYGEPVPLPTPLGFPLATDGLPVYGARGGA